MQKFHVHHTKWAHSNHWCQHVCIMDIAILHCTYEWMEAVAIPTHLSLSLLLFFLMRNCKSRCTNPNKWTCETTTESNVFYTSWTYPSTSIWILSVLIFPICMRDAFYELSLLLLWVLVFFLNFSLSSDIL